MYKLLLCWHRISGSTLKIACIISVISAVATLIVVNSVAEWLQLEIAQPAA